MINVYTIIYDNANFLDLQYLSFKKNFPLQRLTVIDNAPNGVISNDIANFVSRHPNDTASIRVPNPRHDNAGFSHQRALQCAIDNMQDIAIICDPDVFILRKFMDSMDDYVFVGLMQGTEAIRYLWPGFIIINTTALCGPLDLRGALINPTNFDDYVIPDVAAGWCWSQYPEQLKTYTPTDSGGLLCRYFRDFSPQICELSLDFCTEMCDTTGIIPPHLISRYKDTYHFWVIGGGVLHSGRLSNWDNRPSDEVIAKSELVKDIVRHYLDT